MANKIAENAQICRTFGYFLHTLCPEKKHLYEYKKNLLKV